MNEERIIRKSTRVLGRERMNEEQIIQEIYTGAGERERMNEEQIIQEIYTGAGERENE